MHKIADERQPHWRASGWRSAREEREVAAVVSELKDYEEHGGNIDEIDIELNLSSWETFKNYYKSITPAPSFDEHGDDVGDDSDEDLEGVARRLPSGYGSSARG